MVWTVRCTTRLTLSKLAHAVAKQRDDRDAAQIFQEAK
jgi:hypothetical protein